jgi:hypothetical protein
VIDPQLNAKVRARVLKALHAVGVELTNDIKRSISTPSRTVTRGYDKKGRKKKLLGARGSNRSRPGQPPNKDYGVLRSSIAYKVDEVSLTVYVGTNLRYGRYLELGVRGGKLIRPKKGKALSWVDGMGFRRFAKAVRQGRIEPRPFLRPALARNREKILARLRAATGGR